MTGWRTRKTAVDILCAFEKDGRLREHFGAMVAGFSRRDRAFVKEISTGVVRHLKLLDFCIGKAGGVELAPQEPFVRNALRLVAYQLMFTGIPAYAVLNETVEAVKNTCGRKKANFVNAVARRLTGFDCKSALSRLKDRLSRLSVMHSFETWMVKRWSEFYPEFEIEEFLKALNRTPPVFIRVNSLKISTSEYIALLKGEGVECEPHLFIEGMVRIKGKVEVESLPGYKEGYFYVQDPASFLTAKLLKPSPGETILELGAAPGGKTTAMSALSANSARIVAVDVNPERVKLLEENCRRLGVLGVSTFVVDVCSDTAFTRRFAGAFDKVLIDAPCSGTGVLRRHPEGKWNKSMRLILRKQSIQRALLRCAFKLLKPGGVLLFSVCSFEREEGEENTVFARKLGYKACRFPHLPEQLRRFARAGTLRVFPHTNGMDGFFYAVFRKV